MRDRGELRPEADPRHLAVSLVVAHQGRCDAHPRHRRPAPLRAAVNAAVDYVRSFATRATRRRARVRGVGDPDRRWTGSRASHNNGSYRPLIIGIATDWERAL